MTRLSLPLRMISLAVFTTILLSTAVWGTGAETVLYNFCQLSGCADGNLPNGGLVFDAAGNLYGTTVGGGSGGIVFELGPSQNGWAETVLYNFCSQPNCTDGKNPEGSLIFDSLGNLYGTTRFGGTYGYGTVFELSPSQGGWTETVLYSFCPEGGTCGDYIESPGAGVTMDKAGNLFGTTYYDSVFELSPSGGGGWTEAVIFLQGVYEPAGVALDASGNLYGVSEDGANPYPGGFVFELSNPGVWNSTVLFGFPKNEAGKYPDGHSPNSTPVFDTAGSLYGTTEGTAANPYPIGGTAFKLTPGAKGWTFKLLHTFNGKADGAVPVGPLVLDSSGNVYGTTNYGGTGVCQGTPSYCGTVFKISPTPTGYTETVLWSFKGGVADGFHPATGVILDKAGNLYGTTQYGGVGAVGGNAGGVVFEVKTIVTTTTLSSSPNPSTYRQAVTFTAVVTSSLGEPPDGETVTFMKGTKVLGTGTLSGGSASFTTSTLPVGTNAITAVYGGDSNLVGSTSKAVSQVVNKATTATNLASSLNPSNFGQAVTFTASVTPQFGGTVTGSVTFYDGATALKTMALSRGVAKFTTSTLASGSHNITATYNGSTSFDGSSASVTQTVN
jgi:uncharacterized repeat protein (TIGR03803 family)